MPNNSVAALTALNQSTIGELRSLQQRASLQNLGTDEQAIQSRAQRTFTGIGIMAWGAFALGVILIGTSLGMFVFQGKTLNVLGMGTIGLGDVVAILIYRPMDRLQEADAMYAQQTMMVRGWALTVNLELLAMDSNNEQSIRQAADSIQSATEEYCKILGQALSTAPSTGSGSAATSGGSGTPAASTTPTTPPAPTK